MSFSSDASFGSQLPARVQTYVEALVEMCAQDRVPLVSVVLFGSAAKDGFMTLSPTWTSSSSFPTIHYAQDGFD